MAHTKEDARRIYQQHLDEMGEAVAARDFARYARFVQFPVRYETADVDAVIANSEDLGVFFNSLCAQLERHDVPRLDRLCKIAEFTDAQTIRGYHETHLVREDAFVVDSFSGLCTLVQVEGRWLLREAQFAESKGSMPSKLLQRYLSRRAA